MTFPGWTEVLAQVAGGDELPADVARSAVGEILAGRATDAQIGGFLLAVATRGERPGELAAMVDAMLAAAAPLELPPDTIDIVGTGGARTRRSHALNVSTMACFVAAGAGAKVCKHGNRKATSTSGSTDVLDALGIGVELDGPAVRRCVDEVGVGFAFAKSFHPAMRFAGPVRAELGLPTLFNLLGPLSHPGRVDRQVIGVARRELAPLIADALAERGVSHAWVVHGHGALDELAVSGPSEVWEVRSGTVATSTVDPADVGLSRWTEAETSGGDPAANAAIARRVFGGESGAHREIVVLNAAAGLVVAGLVDDLAAGVVGAGAAIDDGSALARLDALVDLTSTM